MKWLIRLIGLIGLLALEAKAQKDTGEYIVDSLITEDSIYYRRYPKKFDRSLSLLYLKSSYHRPTAIKLETWSAKPNTQNQKPNTLKQIKIEGKESNGNAILIWPADSLKDQYSAYWIECSEDSVNFKRISKVPYVYLQPKTKNPTSNTQFAHKTDTSVIEGRVYWFRIIGITQFCTLGDTSNVVKVTIPKRIHSMVNIDTVIRRDSTLEIHIGLYPPTDEPLTYSLFYSDSLTGAKHYLFTSSHASFHIPDSQLPIQFNIQNSTFNTFFSVSASNRTDTILSYPYYYFERDQTPPDKPGGLTGTIDSSGIVRLTWPFDYARGPEELRHRVFRSNDTISEFVEVTDSFATDHFTDTLRLDNLTSDVYYRIVAVDGNYNNSESSEILHLVKPDTIAPVAAVFSRQSAVSNIQNLQWFNSPSVDVGKNFLIRDGIDTLLVWQDTTSMFIDTSVGRHKYVIVTIDRSGNTAMSEPLIRRGTVGGLEKASIRVTIDRDQRLAKVEWRIAKKEQFYSAHIYRAKGEEPMRLLKTVRGAMEYIDRDLQINNNYTYAVKLILSNGKSTGLSEKKSVTY